MSVAEDFSLVVTWSGNSNLIKNATFESYKIFLSEFSVENVLDKMNG